MSIYISSHSLQFALAVTDSTPTISSFQRLFNMPKLRPVPWAWTAKWLRAIPLFVPSQQLALIHPQRHSRMGEPPCIEFKRGPPYICTHTHTRYISISLFIKLKYRFQSANQKRSYATFVFKESLKNPHNSEDIVQNDSTLESIFLLNTVLSVSFLVKVMCR